MCRSTTFTGRIIVLPTTSSSVVIIYL
ncbi:hypothetical protein LINGRAHAP2_LOCUS13077 [Linum grandiflorum]